MIRLLAAPAVVAALVAAGTASGGVPASASGTAATRASSGARGIARMYGFETQVLAAINNLRRARGLVPLRLSAALAGVASRHSLSMAEHGFFEHASLDGSPCSKRVAAAYPRNHSRFWRVGENLAWASPALSPRQALGLWLASPRHRRILLSPLWRDIGLGAVHASAGGVYNGRAVTILTADFGVRRY